MEGLKKIAYFIGLIIFLVLSIGIPTVVIWYLFTVGTIWLFGEGSYVVIVIGLAIILFFYDLIKNKK